MNEDIKVYVNRDNLAVVVCPHCQTDREVEAEKLRRCGHRVKLRCSCDGTFSAFVECRRAYRKETDLPGLFSRVSDGEDQGEMVVKNISLFGIGFITHKPHGLRVGDKVTVEFTLDDSLRSKISTDVIVQCADDDNYVGCEFEQQGDSEGDVPCPDKAIGFYVMP